jgi:pimeloyl-ACP methyl ester carboxylesterase
MKTSIAYAGILGGVLMAASCTPAPDGRAPLTLYKNEEGRNAAYRSYEAAMAQWPVAFKDDWVDTGYGRTHIVVSGREDGLPVFLIPGLFGDATMWFTNVGPLSERYRVYALDMINYAGKSEPAGKPVSTVEDYAAWFAQIMGHYG